jgi:hypothetical protein
MPIHGSVNKSTTLANDDATFSRESLPGCLIAQTSKDSGSEQRERRWDSSGEGKGEISEEQSKWRLSPTIPCSDDMCTSGAELSLTRSFGQMRQQMATLKSPITAASDRQCHLPGPGSELLPARTSSMDSAGNGILDIHLYSSSVKLCNLPTLG